MAALTVESDLLTLRNLKEPQNFVYQASEGIV